MYGINDSEINIHPVFCSDRCKSNWKRTTTVEIPPIFHFALDRCANCGTTV